MHEGNQSIALAVLDMAGTTVTDDGLVIRAFDEAATAVGVPVDGAEREQARRYVLETMGQSKIEVFRALFGSEDRAQEANVAFENAYEKHIDDVAPIPGAAEAISQLRESGVKVALTTGFSPSTQQRLLMALGWQDIADLALAPGDGCAGVRIRIWCSTRSCAVASTMSPVSPCSGTPPATSFPAFAPAHRSWRAPSPEPTTNKRCAMPVPPT